MVNIRKSLLSVILIVAMSFFCFSQEVSNSNNNQSTDNQTTEITGNSDAAVTNVETPNSQYEASTTYFNNQNNNTGNDSSTYKPASTFWTIVKFIFFLALIIVAIYFIMRFFKNKNNVSKSDDEFLRRVSYMTLSPGKTVEIVTLLDKGYILGVTDSNINLISEIDDKELIEALNLNFDKKQTVKKPMNFSDVLDMFMGKNQAKKKNLFDDVEQNISKINRNSRNNENE